MRISPINSTSSLQGVGGIGSDGKVTVTEAGSGSPFKDSIRDAVGEVNELQQQADQAAVKLSTGEIEDVHQAMIAMQKAKLALEFTIQVRNKVVESYQEIMRMQV